MERPEPCSAVGVAASLIGRGRKTGEESLMPEQAVERVVGRLLGNKDAVRAGILTVPKRALNPAWRLAS